MLAHKPLTPTLSAHKPLIQPEAVHLHLCRCGVSLQGFHHSMTRILLTQHYCLCFTSCQLSLTLSACPQQPPPLSVAWSHPLSTQPCYLYPPTAACYCLDKVFMAAAVASLNLCVLTLADLLGVCVAVLAGAVRDRFTHRCYVCHVLYNNLFLHVCLLSKTGSIFRCYMTKLVFHVTLTLQHCFDFKAAYVLCYCLRPTVPLVSRP
jgi:hypothetical protein